MPYVDNVSQKQYLDFLVILCSGDSYEHLDTFWSCCTNLTKKVGQRSDEQFARFGHETIFKALPLVNAPIVASFFPFLAVIQKGVEPIELFYDWVFDSLVGATFFRLAFAWWEMRDEQGGN